jgi:hypothetical protein
MNGSTSAIPPLCGGLASALVLDVAFENFECNPTSGCDKVSSVPQGVSVFAPALSTITGKKELG